MKTVQIHAVMALTIIRGGLDEISIDAELLEEPVFDTEYGYSGGWRKVREGEEENIDRAFIAALESHIESIYAEYKRILAGQTGESK